MAITGTREWAEHSANICRGCSHDCGYCYAKAMAVRFGRSTPDAWRVEVVDERKARQQWRHKSGRIMYPTTHDVTPTTLDASVSVLRSMLGAGNDVLIVSKPHLACVERLCAELASWRERVMFRFTIGSLSANVLRFWEPGAPGPDERLSSLGHAYAAGYRTSISCEPMLDDDVAAVVRAVEPYVSDSIWIGKANGLSARLRLNGADAEHLVAGRVLADSQNDVAIRSLYGCLRSHPLVRWKESIKAVVGLALPTVAGLDV